MSKIIDRVNAGTPTQARRVLILDPDPQAAQRLRVQLLTLQKRYAFTLLPDAQSIAQAHAYFQQEKVDLVLAAVQLTDGSALALAQECETNGVNVFFVVLAPHTDVCVIATEGVKACLPRPVRTQQLEWLLNQCFSHEEAAAVTPYPATLLVSGQEGVQDLLAENVLYARAQEKGSELRTRGAVYVSPLTLQELEQRLPEQWLRIHRSILLNRQAIDGAFRVLQESGEWAWHVRVKDLNEALPVSRRQWSIVRPWVDVDD